MYILKNAFTSIIRNKGRNILVGIIILVIACAATVTLAIKNTATSLINSYENAYEVEATIGFDRSNMKQQFDFTNQEGMNNMKDMFNNMSSIAISDVENYADSSYVKSYYYTYSVGMNANNIEKVSSDFSFQRQNGNETGDTDKNSGNNQEMESSDFTITGYNNVSAMEEFINGNYTITDKEDDAWNLIFNGDYCFINSELAELNEISVGDMIELVDQNNTDNTYTLMVIGIFDENDVQTENQQFSMFANSANMIITNTGVVSNIAALDEDLKATVSPTFILTSYDDADKFESELYEKGMSEYYSVTTNKDEVQSATSSVSNVSSFATTFLIVTLVIGAIVLFVINQINVRERKYEIGVLRTIGMKKSLLTLQFVIELSMVAIVALLLGAGIGSIISKPVGNSLLASEISSSENKTEEISNNFGGNRGGESGPNMNNISGVVSVQAYDSINAVVNFKVILELLAIGIALTLISSISSMISIQKFSPLQILKERS